MEPEEWRVAAYRKVVCTASVILKDGKMKDASEAVSTTGLSIFPYRHALSLPEIMAQ